MSSTKSNRRPTNILVNFDGLTGLNLMNISLPTRHIPHVRRQNRRPNDRVVLGHSLPRSLQRTTNHHTSYMRTRSLRSTARLIRSISSTNPGLMTNIRRKPSILYNEHPSVHLLRPPSPRRLNGTIHIVTINLITSRQRNAVNVANISTNCESTTLTGLPPRPQHHHPHLSNSTNTT